ncbi:unnamed protein product, partial [Prorocentrum cordatum]
RLEAKEEEEDAEERRSRRKRGLRGPLAKARRRPATLGLCYQPWPLADLCAARARASARGGTGAWRASGDRTRGGGRPERAPPRLPGGVGGAGSEGPIPSGMWSVVQKAGMTPPSHRGGPQIEKDPPRTTRRTLPSRAGRGSGKPRCASSGRCPPGRGTPRRPKNTHAWVERPAARKTAREEEQLSRQVGALSVGCSRTPPHPRQKTAHTDRENVLGSARLWSATRESGPGQEWPCQLARGAPPQRRRPGVRGGDLPVRSARTSKMFMLAQSFAADSGGAVGGCGRRAARGGGGSRSSRHLL